MLESHEDSEEHNRAMLCWIKRKTNKNTVDKQIQDQLKLKNHYYFEVLKRVLAVIFLKKFNISIKFNKTL